MANKLPWFKHMANAHDDDFIGMLMDSFGHFGYAAYFIILEILHKDGNGDELNISCHRLCQKLRSRRDRVRMLLEFCQTSGKVKFEWFDDVVGIKINKFRQIQYNLPGKKRPELDQNNAKTVIEGEGEEEGDGEIINTMQSNGSAGVIESSGPKEKKERTTKHGGELLKAVVGRFLELKGVAGTPIGQNPKNWGRWMRDADALLSELYGRVELADECMTEFSVKWNHLGEWGITAVTKRARLWLAEKQAQHSIVGGKG